MFELFTHNELQNLKQSKSLLLVSGGPDSIYLFHLFLKLRKDFSISFDVIHFNHHLRGEESDLEQQFVEEICKKNDVTCFVRHLEFKLKSGLQERARQKRYQECFQLQSFQKYGYFVTAHQREDVLETLLMRKSRGAGLKGLKGIRRTSILKNPQQQGEQVILLRPLINISKDKILQYLQMHDLEYCLDSSNLKKNYFRNQVRHDVLSNWESDLQKDQVLQDVLRIQVVDDYFEKRVAGLLYDYPYFVPLKVWELWPDEIRFRFFTEKIKSYGFKHEIEARHYDLTAKCPVKLDFGESFFFKDESGCYFYAKSDLLAFKKEKILISDSGTYSWKPLGLKLHFKRVVQKEGDPLYINKDQMALPLTLSRADLSEKFTPYGKKSPVPLKKIYQSRRIPIYQRRFLPVLRDGSGKIVALAGLASSHQSRVQDQSKSLYELSIDGVF